MAIKINNPFLVEIKIMNVKFKAVCVSTKKCTLDGSGKNLIKILPNQKEEERLFSVEDDWFNFKLTRRKITYITN